MELEKCSPYREPASEYGFKELRNRSLRSLRSLTLPAFLLGFFAGQLTPAASAGESLIPLNSEWQYYDSAEAPALQWMSSSFDTKAEKGWKTGSAPFAVDFPDTATAISNDGDATPTTYFKTVFDIDRVEDLASLVCYVRANDAVILFLDGAAISASGVERNNANDPGGIWHHPGTSFRRLGFEVPPSKLTSGRHTLGVIVFQNPRDRLRMVFDLALVGLPKGSETQEIIKGRNSEWNYFDGAEPPPANWKSIEFDARNWKSGPGILGYGDPDIATTLDFGPDSKNHPITAWFRKDFDLPEKDSAPTGVEIQFLRDDGLVVYLNGIEMVRDNMPEGQIDPSTVAVDTQNDAYEHLYHLFPFDGSYLRPGRNTVAVEVHQSKASSTDLRFDLGLAVHFEPEKWNWNSAVAVAPPKQINRTSGAPASTGSPGTTTTGVPRQASAKVVNVSDTAAIRSASIADWKTTTIAMRGSSERIYESGDLEEAARRYAASRWATEFAGDARGLDPALKQYLLSTDATALSLEYFDLLSPLDKTRRVYAILNDIFTSSPATLKTYAGLALAISFVYDQAPPANWPHHQVSPSLLPRKLPDPVEAFNFWSATDQRGKTLHPLDKLQLEELKYVVDSPVSIKDLEAALAEHARLTGMGDLYSGIRYDTGRFENGVYNWPHASYDLDTIKKLGGICVDQAYFTTTVAKAHGVPSMLVSGAGQEGNHAWVGFLNKKSWDFNTGRYPESKFVTGTMFDPQTWKQPTDHEIAFLSERFRGSAKYRQSRVHGRFAREFLADGAVATAEKAARAAIAAESRNLEAWNTLLDCLEARKATDSERDTALTDAAKAFGRYADAESFFLEQLAASYAEQGKTKEADKLRAGIIRRNSEARPDLALSQAKTELDNLIRTEPIPAQVAHYKSVINRLDDAGLIAFYALTDPFLRHLSSKGEKDTARDVLKFTRRRLKSSGEGQLGESLADWEKRLSN